jgi:hypothetical protein
MLKKHLLSLYMQTVRLLAASIMVVTLSAVILLNLSGRRWMPQPIDNRFYATIYGEAGGGSPAEISAVTSAFLNRIRTQGYEKALQGSSAYRKKSPQYTKAFTGNLNPFEKTVYLRNKVLIDNLVQNPASIQPYTHFENVRAFGEPPWAKGMQYKDVGRQRFYWK